MLFAFAFAFPPSLQDEIELSKGLVIEASARVKPGVYNLASASETGQVATITVRGKGITVDFQGATLSGSREDTPPDQRKGIGIRIDGENVTIKNAKIRGYKVGLIAWNVKGLKLLDCDVSYNWRQRLLSDREKEDAADWMSYHKNEDNEWLRYGAGAYLSGCKDFEVRALRATGGQCGLMLTNCSLGLVWNCDISFMSAVGLGLYRSSLNRVMHNRFDWCVRGYSHGVYNRGQDSTGILVYEQSNANTFAYNSATHGGDGFFLWAGQSTMDTGAGGCNDNVLYGNDFSHSPANGIEATFSRNSFVNNRLQDCWHGVWGGYSYDSLILGNVFGYNAESIAIEHGQYNRIVGNTFFHDANSVMLWQNDREPDPNWGYPQFRDTRNCGTEVAHNRFSGASDVAIDLGTGTRVKVEANEIEEAKVAFSLHGTHQGTLLSGNSVEGPMPPPHEGVEIHAGQRVDSTCEPPVAIMTRGGSQIVRNEAKGAEYAAQFLGGWNPWPDKAVLPPRLAPGLDELSRLDTWVRKLAPQPLAGGMDPFLQHGTPRGRQFILVDEWGPYDFRRPLLWPSRTEPLDTEEFEVLGPKGSWKAVTVEGCTLSASTGTVPGNVRITGRKGTWQVVLEYTGAATTDSWGRQTAAGQPVRFGSGEDKVAIRWDVRWYAWEEEKSDPRENRDSFDAVLAGPPIATSQQDALDFASGGSPHEGVPSDYFATTADGTFEVQAGRYTVEVTTDDGVRLSLDGQTLINEWKYQGPTTYQATVDLEAGKHALKVAHFEINGYTALKVRLRPVR
ncbi:MAG: right-handed parallel beta-helix repeat-containing protein [Fimbriimonadaceae bacterium]|nr:right-handed parallel beta-helix repeat-containing protein [Fimbriimonadaceae bacterium]